jgi:tetratricopeptide (TPR) repeat protein
MIHKNFLFFYLLIAVSFGINAQQFTQKSREELLSDAYNPNFGDRPWVRADVSESYYNTAVNLYKTGDITEAIKNMEMALSIYTFGVYFYLYGEYLTENYRNAEKAYKKAIYLFQHEYPYKYESRAGYYPHTNLYKNINS